MRLVSLLRRAYPVLLRIAPAVPCALDWAIHELHPFFIHLAAGRRWQREQLPEAALANQRDDRLPAGPPRVPVPPRMLGVGRHQSLLYDEDQIVCGMEGRRGEWRNAPAQADLQPAHLFAQMLRSLVVRLH